MKKITLIILTLFTLLSYAQEGNIYLYNENHKLIKQPTKDGYKIKFHKIEVEDVLKTQIGNVFYMVEIVGNKAKECKLIKENIE